MKQELVQIPNGELEIQQRIRAIRGVQVMLDRDLAELYGVETKVLNQAVKRNADRFPPDFMIQLTKEECLRSQIVTLNETRGKHLKYLPYAFTEGGIAMLSSVLRSPTAIAANIRIMRACRRHGRDEGRRRRVSCPRGEDVRLRGNSPRRTRVHRLEGIAWRVCQCGERPFEPHRTDGRRRFGDRGGI